VNSGASVRRRARHEVDDVAAGLLDRDVTEPAVTGRT
jgi:hypothetical protein